MPENSISHGEILKKIWNHLDLGVIDRHHPFHTPAFSTISPEGPNTRIVVLRRFWRKNPRGLAFHAHLGSPKIKEIEAGQNIAWLFYHPEKRFQLKIKGKASIHNLDELADEQWRATDLLGRRCYIGEAPSLRSEKPTTGLPGHLINRKPTIEESEEGKSNFAVVTTTIDQIDCMELEVSGHRRSLFNWKENGELETRWLTP